MQLGKGKAKYMHNGHELSIVVEVSVREEF